MTTRDSKIRFWSIKGAVDPQLLVRSAISLYGPGRLLDSRASEILREEGPPSSTTRESEGSSGGALPWGASFSEVSESLSADDPGPE